MTDKALTKDKVSSVGVNEYCAIICSDNVTLSAVRDAVMETLARIQDEGTERADVILLEQFPVFFEEEGGA